MNLLEEQQHEFILRHIGPNEKDSKEMLKTIGVKNLDELIDQNSSFFHPVKKFS